MKKLLCFVLPLAVAMLVSCTKSDSNTTYTATVTVSYPDTYIQQQAVGADVSIKNTTTGVTYTGVVGSDGTAVIQNVEPGAYTVTSSISLDAQQAKEVSGIEISVGLRAVKNVEIYGVESASFAMVLEPYSQGSLVIGQVYYQGCKTPSGANYKADQFIEIYNNSDQVVYLDGLFISDIWGNPSGTTPTEFQSDNSNVYASTVWQIPGTGQDYPLEAGKSIVIAQTALNHLEQNANSIDLSSSKFETYVEKQNGTDVDVAESINLNLKYFTFLGYDYYLNMNGPAIVIWRTDNFDALAKCLRPGTTSTALYIQIPNSLVIDGVEILADASCSGLKRLNTPIDATFAYGQGLYSGYTMKRKVANTTDDGRKVLQDSNSSADDFECVTPVSLGF